VVVNGVFLLVEYPIFEGAYEDSYDAFSVFDVLQTRGAHLLEGKRLSLRELLVSHENLLTVRYKQTGKKGSFCSQVNHSRATRPAVRSTTQSGSMSIQGFIGLMIHFTRQIRLRTTESMLNNTCLENTYRHIC
jgi:hypothetical protein